MNAYLHDAISRRGYRMLLIGSNQIAKIILRYILDWQIAVLTELLQQVGNDRCIRC